MEAPVSEYESAVATAMDGLRGAAELVAGSIFALAASKHTDTPYDQRQLAAVLMEDSRTRYKDILRKVTKSQRIQMEAFIDGLCKGKK
jgi:hypothetical protein